jgi:glycosyltransferase involved in cell wall biosynthesis
VKYHRTLVLSTFFLAALFYVLHSTTQERPMVVVIPSYNNSAWYQKNLDSVFMQVYTNYRIIYIDDCSLDNNATLVEAYIHQRDQAHRVHLIKNSQHRGALANHYTAVQLCKDDEIVVQLDGDDWFAHEYALQRINQEYENPDVWLTYGQFEVYPDKRFPGTSQKMPQHVINKNSYREHKWITSAPRTFYAGLFKQIQRKDLMYQGDFYPIACDWAFMFPMLEMAHGRIAFIPDIIYVYNCQTPNNDFKTRLKLQKKVGDSIRKLPKYKRVEGYKN